MIQDAILKLTSQQSEWVLLTSSLFQSYCQIHYLVDHLSSVCSTMEVVDLLVSIIKIF